MQTRHDVQEQEALSRSMDLNAADEYDSEESITAISQSSEDDDDYESEGEEEEEGHEESHFSEELASVRNGSSSPASAQLANGSPGRVVSRVEEDEGQEIMVNQAEIFTQPVLFYGKSLYSWLLLTYACSLVRKYLGLGIYAGFKRLINFCSFFLGPCFNS